MIEFSPTSLARLRELLKQRPTTADVRPDSFQSTQIDFVQLVDSTTGDAYVMAYEQGEWNAIGSVTLMGLDDFGNPATLNNGQWYLARGYGKVYFAGLGCCPQPSVIADFIRGVGQILSLNTHELADRIEGVGTIVDGFPPLPYFMRGVGEIVSSVGATEGATDSAQGVGQLTSITVWSGVSNLDALEGVGQITSTVGQHQTQISTLQGVGEIQTSVIHLPTTYYLKGVGQIKDDSAQGCNTLCWNVPVPIFFAGVDFGTVEINYVRTPFFQWTAYKTMVVTPYLYTLSINLFYSNRWLAFANHRNGYINRDHN